MVELAFIFGIFSYVVFGLGILGKLGELRVLGILWVLGILVLLLAKRNRILKAVESVKLLRQDKVSVILISLLLLAAVVNLVGALGPELGFDALWYHLTIPKIYLQHQKVFFLQGNLFYYSAMPKLTEMLYLTSLVFSPFGTMAKLIHFSFGILSAIVLYQLSRRYLERRESLLAVLAFYTTLIVGWESITAYVDLARTFFEILALKLFLDWIGVRNWENRGNKLPASPATAGTRYSGTSPERKENIKLYESAMMMGLAISTKLLAFVTLPVFILLVLVRSRRLLFAINYLLFAFLIPLPWFVFAYACTGRPFYPVFSGILDPTHWLVGFNLVRFFRDFWQLFFRPQDLISPIFLIFIPLLLLRVIKGNLKVGLRLIGFYVILSLIGWYFTPRTGGSRFILPYLPALSLLIVGTVSEGGKFWSKMLFVICTCSAVVNIGYRALANKKFLPVILRRQTREHFLAERLNFVNGDFLDIDGDVKKIVKNDWTLIYGPHNLFYVDFPFVDFSYAPKLLPFSFVLVQNAGLPKDVDIGGLVYQNLKTGVRLYLYKGKY